MSGLIKGQVINLLKCLRQQHGYNITLICIWQPWVQILQKAKINEMKNELSESGIELENYPLAILPSRYFMYDYRTLPLLMGYLTIAFRFLNLKRFDLIHSRSYVPSYIVAKLNSEKFYKCIFDMRSLLPEEYVTVGKWSLGSPTYRLWKKYEKYAVNNSEAFIAVSQEMKEQADNIIDGKNADLVYLMVNMQRLQYDESIRLKVRAQNSLVDKFVIVYTGSLGFDWLWNNIHNYAVYYEKMKIVYDNLFFVFIVPEILNGFNSVLKKHGIAQNEYLFVQGDSEIAKWFSAADAGIHVMSNGPESHTRFGVKVVEYLANGLSVVTNSGVGAAASFVEANGVGFRLDLDDQFNKKFYEFVNNSGDRKKKIEIANSLFSVESASKKYAKIYERVLN